MVSEAMDRCRPLRLWSVDGRQADAASLPFADGSFDGVVAMHMMYHLADPAAGIAEMARVLKPGGWLAVTTNGAGNMRGIYELTTVFGSAPSDPSGAAFGYDRAERLMREQFGNVVQSEHPARLRATDPEDVYLALTSYPPGDSASDSELAAFRAAIGLAFERGHGVLDVRKESALFFSRKAG
jgi:ubiquinone/menaquinone biosynthesis C-methylase UbiE